jgi:tetratricopeptide (TPR) repeat protein
VAARSAPPQARSFRFNSPPRGAPDKGSRPEIAASGSPVSLTASDGTGLSLVALRADAVVDGPLAFTQLRMTFDNPEDRVIEGQFRITLPVSATVSRFAMQIGGEWQEGEVVELQAARRAYEDFLHRRQDPALLEQAPGNEFSARVFPIPARGRKEIILSYSQELVSSAVGEESFRIPLRGLPKLGSMSIRVFAGGKLIAKDDQREIVPVEDFRAPVARGAALRSGDLAAVRVAPAVDAAPDEVESLLVLVDTSASRALGFEDQARMVESLIGALAGGAGDVPVLVAAFDQEVDEIYRGGARGYDAAATRRLLARRPLGASDLGAALRWAGGQRSAAGSYRRVVMVSDGVATAGESEAEPLRAAVKRLGAAGVERLDAVVVGGIRDQDRLAALVTSGLSRDGAVIDGAAGPAAIADKLTRRSRSGIQVVVEGARWSWPRRLDAVQAGDQALVYARIPEGKPLRVTLDGKPVAVAADQIARAERPLLERAVARAEIASLTASRDALAPAEKKRREELKQRIVSISTSKRVLSPFTGLLVLETEADYARFGIDRRALADILAVGDGGLALVHRSARTLIVASAATKSKDQTGADSPMKLEEGKAGKKSPSAPADQDPGAAGQEGGVEVDAVEENKGRAAANGPSGGGAVAATSPPRVAPPEPEPAKPAPAERPAEKVDSDDRKEAEGTLQGASPRIAESRADRGRNMAEPTRDAVAAPAAEIAADGEAQRRGRDPYTGNFRAVMQLVRRHRADDAVTRATSWLAESPGDVMALVALGEALEAKGDRGRAARAYGSMIDLFPQRADLRRFAGERLERMSDKAALALAIDTYTRAADQRADHPASHRLLAFALLRQGKYEQAFAAVERGLRQVYPDGRFAGAREILAEDLGLVAAAWMRAAPRKSSAIRARLDRAGGRLEDGPSVRFVLNWETDANDVDFHIHDGAGGHAYYGNPQLGSGGRLYADVTTGYGPECFTVRGERKQRAYPYRLEAHYFSRGPMGYGMGKLEIIDHDGAGKLRFEERPFVIMQDDAFVDLGTLTR